MEVMQVTANITRRDLFMVGLCMLPRSRANWYAVAVIAAGSFALLVYRDGTSAAAMMAALVVALGGGMGAVLGAFPGGFAQLMLTADQKSGVRGVREFSLSSVGLHESTTVNSSHFTWSGIKAVVKLRQYIVVRINAYSAYIIPCTSFSSRAQFDVFFEQAAAYWRMAHRTGLPTSSDTGGTGPDGK